MPILSYRFLIFELLNFELSIFDLSFLIFQLKIEQFKMREAHNSKLKTQNCASGRNNSKFKNQNSKFINTLFPLISYPLRKSFAIMRFFPASCSSTISNHLSAAAMSRCCPSAQMSPG